MRTFLLTDTHLGHEKVKEYCNRPDDFNERILRGLKQISPGDTLIHLGDFCMGKDQYWHEMFMKELPGVKRILVRGNHDRKSNSWYMRNGWDFVCDDFSK